MDGSCTNVFKFVMTLIVICSVCAPMCKLFKWMLFIMLKWISVLSIYIQIRVQNKQKRYLGIEWHQLWFVENVGSAFSSSVTSWQTQCVCVCTWERNREGRERERLGKRRISHVDQQTNVLWTVVKKKVNQVIYFKWKFVRAKWWQTRSAFFFIGVFSLHFWCQLPRISNLFNLDTSHYVHVQ